MTDNQKNAVVLPEINERTRYIMNAEKLGLTCPVRVHDIITAEQAARIIATPKFRQRMQSATSSNGALAITKESGVTWIQFPSNIFGAHSGTGSAGQNFSVSALAEQTHFILNMYGASQGRLVSPLKNAEVASPVVENDGFSIKVILKNGETVVFTAKKLSSSSSSK